MLYIVELDELNDRKNFIALLIKNKNKKTLFFIRHNDY